MAVSGVSNTTATTSSSLSGSSTGLADNFDTFLNILTTQLKNQNPLDPMDTNAFTQQLVQFSGVEQQLKTNKFLESLMLSSQSSVNTDAVSYIGKEVTASGVQAELKDGGATWAYNAQATASSAIVTIKDAQGNVVYSETGSLAQGPGNFLWDGKGSDGSVKPDGTYTISIDGKNLAGQNVAVSTSTTGIVSGVDFSGVEPILTVGQSKLKLSSVSSVKIPSSSPTSADPNS
ncbi:flagellar hook assembly protein FlgD [Devosia rhodophyticola]|uniref:Basal-body rod modification protein FlgD n=1 Tax=Devosia rhodophyticola TaxID=3026423 RepID=A0ABY7YUT2_9HYPH|nr:flagellar hook assembly protein FlgD [Devosia rhodophyticola]WDR04967.1 flagellar hook assembly protein FlgD [Devosia rhodophyticola]